MELTEALRTTGAVREFTDQAVDDAVLARVLDTARFAPSGGNAQAWRVVVVKDAANRRQLRDCLPAGFPGLPGVGRRRFAAVVTDQRPRRRGSRTGCRKHRSARRFRREV